MLTSANVGQQGASHCSLHKRRMLIAHKSVGTSATGYDGTAPLPSMICLPVNGDKKAPEHHCTDLPRTRKGRNQDQLKARTTP